MHRRRANEKKTRSSAFVPSVVFTTAVIGVVPACVVGCSNGDGRTVLTVACSYCGVAAVAYVGYDAGHDGSDAAGDAPEGGATGDAPGDGTVGDAPLGVADAAFGSG